MFQKKQKLSSKTDFLGGGMKSFNFFAESFGVEEAQQQRIINIDPQPVETLRQNRIH